MLPVYSIFTLFAQSFIVLFKSKFLQSVSPKYYQILKIKFFVPIALASRSDRGRVAIVREKYLENEIFSRSGKSQGILWMVREI